MTTYYCTRYVLTRGIISFDGGLQMPRPGAPIYVSETTRWVDSLFCRLGRDCFVTLGEAEKDAVMRVDRHIKGLQKKLKQASRQAVEYEAGRIPCITVREWRSK